MTLPVPTDWLRAAAAASPAAPALVADGAMLTFGELDELVDRTVAALLRHGGASPGARIGIAASRTISTVTLLWATWRLGAVAVVFDPADPQLRQRSQALVRRWGLSGLFTAIDVGDADVDRIDVTPRAQSAHTWVASSGSSGEPKMVVITHGNVAAAVDASRERLGNGRDDRWLLVLPLFHVGGLSILWRSAAAGGCVVLHERFDPLRSAAAMASGDVTMASLVPTMLRRILEVADGGFAGMRAVLVGGAAATDALIARALEADLPVVTTYGLTEATSQVATVVPGTMPDALGSCGPPLRGMTVAIADPDDEGVGVITIDGPAVSPGYAGAPARVGPFVTGDLGRWDQSGRLVVVGRGDEVIVTGGENVAPSIVERVLESHPAVVSAAVVGVPDDEWGTRLVAAVVGDGNVDADHLAAHAATQLRPAQRPKEYRFVAELPLLANGKINRPALLRSVAGG